MPTATSRAGCRCRPRLGLSMRSVTRPQQDRRIWAASAATVTASASTATVRSRAGRTRDQCSRRARSSRRLGRRCRTSLAALRKRALPPASTTRGKLPGISWSACNITCSAMHLDSGPSTSARRPAPTRSRQRSTVTVRSWAGWSPRPARTHSATPITSASRICTAAQRRPAGLLASTTPATWWAIC